MKVLVIGNGGREHTLCWKLKNDSRAPEIFCAPGNAGTAALGTNLDLVATDVEGITEWAKANQPDLTVIGPEAPLCAGLADALETAGFRVFGPRKAAATPPRAVRAAWSRANPGHAPPGPTAGPCTTRWHGHGNAPCPRSRRG